MLSISQVTLTVLDLDAVSAFYQKVVGLHRLSGDADSVALGTDSAVLLQLRSDPAARRSSRREAGLFHTAFVLPARADLGRWAQHAIETGAPITGASDHIVSEAIYLDDPEGNGVEIYADRARSQWRWQDGLVTMATDRLDMPALLASGGGQVWQGVPPGAVIGHMHLQVGAIPAAEAFYAGVLGVPVTARYPGGTFYGAGGYHHQLATNIWNSRGAGMRSAPATGLAEVVLMTDLIAGPETLLDPWGTLFRRVPMGEMN